jgi:hypothetical protein
MVVAVVAAAVAVVWLTALGLPPKWISNVEAMTVCAESVVIGVKRRMFPTNGGAVPLRIADPSISRSVRAHHPVRRFANGGYAAVW